MTGRYLLPLPAFFAACLPFLIACLPGFLGDVAAAFAGAFPAVLPLPGVQPLRSVTVEAD